MHVGLIAVRGSAVELRSAFPDVWPTYEIARSQEKFANRDEVWSWMDANERRVLPVRAATSGPEMQCVLLTSADTWTVLMDPSYLLASDAHALQELSLRFGIALSFVVETTGGCAYFSCYESGSLRRSITYADGQVEMVGRALPEEMGIDVTAYYMDESEALMRAYGLPPLDELPVPASTIALALIDRTDYGPTREAATPTMTEVDAGDVTRRTPPIAAKPWWKFW